MSGNEKAVDGGAGVGVGSTSSRQDVPRGQILQVRSTLGAVRRGVRRAVEQARHSGRRRRAHERLRALGTVQRVLFVCHGNIYRSPYAEGAFLHQLKPSLHERVSVASAGFVGPGRPAPAESVALAAAQGFDLTAHRSQLLSPGLVKESDLVVVMSAAQEDEICRRFSYPRRRVLVLGDLDPEPISTRDVADPWNQPVEVLQASAARVTRCTRVLAAEISAAFDGVAGTAGNEA